MRYDTYSIKELLGELTDEFKGVSEIYLFGSRLHCTKSIRSDVDLLITVNNTVAGEDVRDFALSKCPALDFFLVDGGVATSCSNGSKVRANDKKNLIKNLGAVKIWDKSAGFLPADIDWEFHVVKGMPPMMTTLVSSLPFPSKAEELSSEVPTEVYVNDGSKWSSIKDHPIWVVVTVVCAAVLITFAVTYELRIVPLEREITILENTIKNNARENEKQSQSKVPNK